MYQRKTRDIFEIWTNYGYGWECETTEETLKEAKQQIKCYRKNTNADIKIKKCRELLKNN